MVLLKVLTGLFAMASGQIVPALPDTTCSHTFASNTYDLSALAYSQGVGDEEVDTVAGLFTLNPCAITTNPGVCAESGGSACLYSPQSGGQQHQFLGVVAAWDEPSTVGWTEKNGGGGVKITFNNGDACEGGKNGKYSFELTLNCDKTAGNPKPSIFITTTSNCSFQGTGTTAFACPQTAISPVALKSGVSQDGSGPKAYYFIDTDDSTVELGFQIQRTPVSSGVWGAYVRLEGTPTSSEFDFFAEADADILNVTVPKDKILTGHKYFILVEGADSTQFSITANNYVCPGSGTCSGHGTCVSGTCDCSQGYVTPALDCSASIADLTLPASQSDTATGSSVHYYRVSPGSGQHATLVARLGVDGDVSTYPMSISWRMDDFPEGSTHDGFETITDASQSVFLKYSNPPPNQVFIIAVRGAVNSDAIQFQLDVSVDNCIDGCNGHGQCMVDETAYYCRCDSGWTGLGCSNYQADVNSTGSLSVEPLGTVALQLAPGEAFRMSGSSLSVQFDMTLGSLPSVYACWTPFRFYCGPQNYDQMINPYGVATSTTMVIAARDFALHPKDHLVITFVNEASTGTQFTYKFTNTWSCPAGCTTNKGTCEGNTCKCPKGRKGVECEIPSSKYLVNGEESGETHAVTAFLVILFFSLSIGLGICMVQKYDICDTCCESGGVTYQAQTVNSGGAYYGTTDDI